MRENMGVYRGKRIYNGEWLEGSLLFYPDVNRAFMSLGRFHKTGDFFEIDKKTIGQYTGLPDKNGKKIFEGDIIKTHYANAIKSDFIECVVFRNGKFCGECTFDTGGKMYAPLADGVEHIPQDKSVYMEWCEVIGNIHDNPELLEVSEDD